MKSWKPWEELYGEVEDKEELVNLLNVNANNPFPTTFESYENLRTNRPIRKATAGVHPEDLLKNAQ